MQHLDRPVVCPVLIGRAPHLEGLERYLGHALENRGQTLLVAGEAGVGKSRFVAEARERAAQHGLEVRPKSPPTANLATTDGAGTPSVLSLAGQNRVFGRTSRACRQTPGLSILAGCDTA